MPDFSDTTKKILAHKAGYHCSFLGCGAFTGGPAPITGLYSTNLGQAAHISGARIKSARFDKSLNDAARADISNGIWLCLKHARMIDLNEGDAFSTPLLKRYKEDHELKMKLFQEGLPVYSGAVTKFTIEGIIPFRDRLSLTFGKNNLLYGVNGSGKSTIGRLISILGDHKKLEDRKVKNCDDVKKGYCNLEFFFNKLFIFNLNVVGEHTSLIENGKEISTYPRLFNFIHFEKFQFENNEFNWKDFREIFSIPEGKELIFVEEVSKSDLIFFHSLRLDKDEIKFKFDRSEYEDTYSSGGGAAQELLMLEFMLYQIRFYANRAPCILILEQSFFPTLDTHWQNRLLEALKKLNLQVFVTFYNLKNNVNYSGFDAWEIYRDEDYDIKLPLKCRRLDLETVTVKTK